MLVFVQNQFRSFNVASEIQVRPRPVVLLTFRDIMHFHTDTSMHYLVVAMHYLVVEYTSHYKSNTIASYEGLPSPR